MRATTLTLAAAALAAGTLVLTGCEPASTTGSSGSSGGVGVSCDPTGFGPLSGCDGTDSSGPQQDSSGTPENDPAAHEDNSADKPAETEPAPCADDPNDLDLGVGRFGDAGENGCDSPDDGQTWDQKTTEITEGHYTVTVTWIVVSIEFTGFRECVLGLREATAKTDEDFSRRVTTTEDCKAQQVHTVYRPLVSSTGR
ncbi:MAG: hypothetical protein LC799_22190 [Actinobacteria bacterium]|nr:hypothetical protein [Actinomycetota bacterium]